MRKTPGPRRMARLVAEWRESGESQAGFARRHRIAPWTFWYWCRKGTKATSRPDAAAGTNPFVPVHVAMDPAATVLEIVFSGGEHVRIGPGASADLVRAAVAAVRSAC